jgi:hypothetical protein
MLQATAAAPVNVTVRAGNQGETAVAVDPTNPQRIVVAFNDESRDRAGIFLARSTDGGTAWARGVVGNEQVAVIYQQSTGNQGPAAIFVALDAHGTAAGGFAAPITVTTTNLGGFGFITPQPDRSVDAEADPILAQSSGVHVPPGECISKSCTKGKLSL